jgi:hypothetical protein
LTGELFIFNPEFVGKKRKKKKERKDGNIFNINNLEVEECFHLIAVMLRFQQQWNHKAFNMNVNSTEDKLYGHNNQFHLMIINTACYDDGLLHSREDCVSYSASFKSTFI